MQTEPREVCRKDKVLPMLPEAARECSGLVILTIIVTAATRPAEVMFHASLVIFQPT